jgi:hypothetical protein
MNAKSNARYAYLVTLIGVVVAGISMVYAAVRSLMAPRGFRSHSFNGNFTGSQFGNFTARQFGNFTGSFNGPPRFAYDPYGGFVNDLAIVAAIIAIVGIVWLGIALNSQHRL